MQAEPRVTSEPAPTGGEASALPRGLLAIAGGLIALLLVSVAVAVLASRPAELYPSDTPEGAFQRYLAAFDEGDVDAAYGYFSSNARRGMSLDSYRRQVADYRRWANTSERLTLDRIETRGDRATLVLSVHQRSGDLFGDGWSYPVDILMVHQDGSWLIDQPLLRLEALYEFEPY